MGKRSKRQRRAVRYEKDQPSCMWSLISIFDFRHGRSARKLLPDRRHGSKHFGSGLSKNKFEVLSNLDENGQVTALDVEETIRAEVTVETGKPSVKKLIEEEMMNEHGKKNDASSFEVRNQSGSAHSNQIRRDHKGTKKAHKKSCDMVTFDSNVAEKLQSECSCDQNSAQQSAKNIGLDEIIRELSHQIHLESNHCVNHELNGKAPVPLDLKHHDIQEKLSKVMRDFINEKLINGKDLTEEKKLQNPRELKELLELISSDKKVFLEQLQDPNSLLVEYVQNLQETHEVKDEKPKLGADLSEQKLVKLRRSEDVVNDKHRHFLSRKIKSQEVDSFAANEFSDASNRIVILKPAPTDLQDSDSKSNFASSASSHGSVGSKGSNDRVGSHFFLSEIKRKLKYAIGKQQCEVSTSNLFDGVGKDSAGKKSPSKEHFFIERIARPSVVSKRADKKGRTKGSELSMKHDIDNVSNQKISNIYIEAKKHLSEMLSSRNDGSEPSSGQVPKTLGRILSLSEFNPSPIGSPGRSWENSCMTAKVRISTIDKLKPVDENTWSPKHEGSVSLLGQEAQNSKSESPVSNNSDYKAQAPNMNPSLQENTIHDIEVAETVCPSKDEMNPAGGLGFVKEEAVITHALSEPPACSSARNEHNCNTSILLEDVKYLEPLEQQDSNDENQLLSSLLASPCSVTPKKVADLGSLIDIPERPSPVSVLEPLFTEDDTSPERTISQPDVTIQPLWNQFEEPETSASDRTKCARSLTEEKESVFESVKLVIQASGCNWDEFYSRLLSSNQLLDPSLVDEIEFYSDQLCRDLLFDCINEVLVEVCENYFGRSPLVSFVKPGIRPLPNMRSTILEISEGVYWHLLQLPLPRTLEQIVGKDMARTGTWLDLQFDTDHIGFDLGEAILVDLLEDTILSYASEDTILSYASEDTILNYMQVKTPYCWNESLLLQLNGNECY